jgi:hypothetical protein
VGDGLLLDMNINNLPGVGGVPGISFIIRVRNEERSLYRSLESLQHFEFPHEIIVILHRCVDRSFEIAKSFPNTRIFEFDRLISRAGFETLITPVASEHSIMSYYDWAFAKGKHLWRFKWDADFIATAELIEYLNSRAWDHREPTRIQVPTRTMGRGPKSEPYLSNAGYRHSKWIFYEYNKAIFEHNVVEQTISQEIIHDSPIDESSIKPYWREPSWFSQTDTEEATELRRRYRFLVQLIGPEPAGLARDQNPTRDGFFHAARSREAELNAEGIYLWS